MMAKFNIYCPGCGGTRAFENMLYGHFIKSTVYHPVVLYIMIMLITSFISYILYIATCGRVMYYELTLNHLIIADLIFIVYWIFKNIVVLVFHYYIY